VLAACLAALAVPSIAAARPAPVTWCGTDEVADDRVPDVEVTSSSEVRFVYAVPADGADNFKTYASGIATDAQWISDWWQQQDASRVPRFDRYSFPGCTTRFGGLDIGFVRLPHPGSFYLADETPADELDGDLGTLMPQPQKTIVYYDGPSKNGRVCGVTNYLADHDGGRFGIAYVLLQSGCGLSPPGGGGSAEVATHELLHNLGAAQPQAPHICPQSSGHPCDSATDILYPFLGNGSTLDVVTLDFGRDDYYAHGGTWWDVQDSAWLEHLPQFPLTLSVSGSGTLIARAGTVALPCDTGCQNVVLDNGTTVTLSAVPESGWTVGSWTGGCTGVSLSCTLTLSAATAATVTFVRVPARVSVSLSGKGKVTSAPRGIACARTCVHLFPGGTNVRLTATPAKGWRFAGWSGACTGTRACLVRDGGSARARFLRKK
jgi:hypothetical protein